MPRRLMDNLEGEVADEEFHECALGNDILSADLNGEDSLLLNIGQYRVFGVAHNVSRLVCCKRVGKVPKPRFNVVSECVPALVGDLDIAVGYPYGVRRMMTTQHHRLLGRLGVEYPHGDLLAPLSSFLLQIGFHILKPYGISVCFCGADTARNDAVVQHPRYLIIAQNPSNSDGLLCLENRSNPTPSATSPDFSELFLF